MTFKGLTSFLFSRSFQKIHDGVEISIPNGESFFVRTLKVDRVQLSSQFGMHAFVSHVTGGGFTIEGFGEDSHEIVALQKSLAEGLERLVFYLSTGSSYETETSNGWAAHPRLKLASNNARFELLERDAVISQWLRGQPFQELAQSDIEKVLQPNLLTHAQTLTWSRPRILFAWHGFTPVALVMFQSSDKKSICSSAAGENIFSAINKAASESIRIAEFANFQTRRNESLIYLGESRTDNRKLLPIDHGLYFAYHQAFPEEMIFSETSLASAKAQWAQCLVSHQDFFSEISVSVVCQAPIYVVRAYSSRVQDLYFGPLLFTFNSNKLNMKRLNARNFDDLNCKYPHPVA
jgi:hypothetical protein